MHQATLTALNRHIGGVLGHCNIDDGWPVFDSVDARLRALGNELVKHNSPHLVESDAFIIFYDLVVEALPKATESATKLTGALSTLLTKDAYSALESKLLKYIQSIPRSYEVLLPIPNSKLPLATVEFAPNLGLRIDHLDKNGKSRGKLLSALSQGWDPELTLGRPYLYLEARGYIRKSLDGQTARSALSALKIVLQQGLARGIFTISSRPNVVAGLSLLGSNTHYSIEKARLLCLDKHAEPRPNFYVDLPLDASRLIQKLEFSTVNKTLTAAAEKNTLKTTLVEQFRLPALLATSTTPESSRVRAASEWCFDSYASESQTLAFLQVCIGLEAIFGEDSDSEALTKTLANRCAYLLGTSVKERSSIRDKFLALYKARSKIVHGNVLSLAASERGHLEWGRIVLEYAIAKELRHLGLEKA